MPFQDGVEPKSRGHSSEPSSHVKTFPQLLFYLSQSAPKIISRIKFIVIIVIKRFAKGSFVDAIRKVGHW